MTGLRSSSTVNIDDRTEHKDNKDKKNTKDDDDVTIGSVSDLTDPWDRGEDDWDVAQKATASDSWGGYHGYKSGKEKAEEALTDWEPFRSAKQRARKKDKAWKSSNADSSTHSGPTVMSIREPQPKSVLGKGKGKAKGADGIKGRAIWSHRVFHFPLWVKKGLRRIYPDIELGINATPREDFLDEDDVSDFSTLESTYIGTGTVPAHMVLDVLRGEYGPKDLIDVHFARKSGKKVLGLPPMSRSQKLELCREIFRRVEQIKSLRKDAKDEEGKPLPEGTEAPGEEDLHITVVLAEVLPQQTSESTMWGITLLLDQTASPKPHKDRVHWRNAIARVLLVEDAVPIKDLTLYELDNSTGALQLWENEPLKNIAFIELSTEQVLSKGGPIIGTKDFLSQRMTGIPTEIPRDSALDQRSSSFGTNTCELTVDLPQDDALISRVTNKIKGLWPGVLVGREESRAYLARNPRVTLVVSPPQDNTLAPYTLTLSKWALEKEVGVLVGTRFLAEDAQMRLVETFGPRDLTLWGRFYLRSVQLAADIPAESKKKSVPLFLPIRVDLWAANLGVLFGGAEVMNKHFANFDSTEHYRPKEAEKEGSKKKEAPAVIHAVYDGLGGRGYQRNKARSTPTASGPGTVPLTSASHTKISAADLGANCIVLSGVPDYVNSDESAETIARFLVVTGAGKMRRVDRGEMNEFKLRSLVFDYLNCREDLLL